MKRSPFLFMMILTFAIEIILCFYLINGIEEQHLDPVVINECVKSVEDSFDDSSNYVNLLPYTVINNDGEVLYQNAEDIADSINEAIQNGDTIVDIKRDDGIVGKIIFANENGKRTAEAKGRLIAALILFSVIQLVLIILYWLYVKRNVIDPFNRMNDFAQRIAAGNLDIPLEVDKKQVFGTFTEAFDIMRSELKKAKAAEKKANDEKKETVAKLSHDIKTPVASIKSSSEIGYELSKDEKSKEYFHLINEKADQIKGLTDNLFNNAVNDVAELTVSPVKCPSDVITTLIKNADYRKKAGSFDIPSCDVFMDKLRLQQVFDNLFMNSYKYADTDIEVKAEIKDDHLIIDISDSGPGVKAEEIPLLTEKYKRGSNSSDKDGAGLGLYLTSYFLSEMDGNLMILSDNGFTARVFLRLV